MKKCLFICLSLFFVLEISAQKKKVDYKTALGVSFNQGLWFPSSKEPSPYTFFNSKPKYQFGGSVNFDCKIFKPIHAFCEVGVDKTVIYTNKVILDSTEYSISSPYYNRLVSYETENFWKKSVTKYYVVAGISYQLPITKFNLSVGIGVYFPFYSKIRQQIFYADFNNGFSREYFEPIFSKGVVGEKKYAEEYGSMRLSYMQKIATRLYLRANFNYFVKIQKETGIRQVITLGFGFNYILNNQKINKI